MATQPLRRAPDRGIAISLDRGCLVHDGREIRLRAKTFQVLVYLQERHGRLVTKEELLQAVWPSTFVSDDSLTKCIGEIRQALGDDDRQLLKTVARRGFILDAPLATTQPADNARNRPALRDAERPAHNLPAPLTSFIGREREKAELGPLLASARLLTLTGAGGCGKTRLALEVARQALGRFPDGVWLVDLAGLDGPPLVAQTVASVLDVRQSPGRSLLQSMVEQLRLRRMLLLLDNCEHVIAAAAELAETLLRAAPGLTILATSREALGIEGETRWRVPSLTMPDPRHATSSGELLQYEAVRLLVERAAAVDSTFAVTNENAGTIADVCWQLDGIPLAIELAAARLNVLSIGQIGARLHDRFRLLRRTGRTIGRQRTLEATVDWSYDQLPEGERLLLQRLTTFAGGWTLDAAEHVCAGDGLASEDVLDLMTRLVDKSLVIVDGDATDGHRRYRFLETVRHYARDRLQQSGGADAVRARHFEYFLALARRAEPELVKGDQLRWLDTLQADHDNLRAALEWRLACDDSGVEALDLAVALHWFWLKRVHLAEGQRGLERAIAKCSQPPPVRQAQALVGLGAIVFFQGDFERAGTLLDQAAATARAAGALPILAFARGLETIAAMERGDGEAAARCAAESRDAARASDQPWVEAISLTYYAYEALYAGDVDRAGELHERGLAFARMQGDLWAIGIVLLDLATLRLLQQRYADARALCAEGLALHRQFGDRMSISWWLGVLAGADAAEGQPVRAARLRGAMEGLLESIGSSPQPTFTTLVTDRLFPAVERELGTEAYQQALAAGRAMSISQAIALGGKGESGNWGVGTG